MTALIAWVAVIAALLILEGIGLLHQHDQWPTLSDMFRTITRPFMGRLVLFALWLWLGWHLFVRGWRFFLRG